MALILADRVLETSTSEGLGTFALAGAQTGYQTFSSGIGNGNTCYYTINGQTTEQWEVGIGTVGAGTLARTTLISSNTGSFINFVAGVKNVFVTQPASKSIYKDENGNAIPLGSASATQLDITAQGDLRLQDTTGGQYVALQAPATLASSYTLTLPVDDGTSGQALITDGSGVLSWSTAASGDVYGPASSTDNAVARFDSTTGKIIQNSVVTIADTTGNMAGVGTLGIGGAVTTGEVFALRNTAETTATIFGLRNLVNVNQATTTTAYGIADQTQLLSPAAVTSLIRFYAAQGSFTGTATNQYGFFAQSTLTSATNNYGFYGAIPSGTGRFNFYAAGTADNYFAGKVGIGMVPSNQLDVSATTYCAVGVTSGTVQGQIAANAGGSVDVRAVSNHALILYSNNTERMRITNAGTISLGAAPGSESLRVTPVASAVNYVEALGALTAQPPTLRASGSDTNIPLWISSKGTSTLNFYTNSFSTLQFSITNAASAVNYLQVTGAATGNTPNLSAQGSDAAVNISYSTKGTGFHNFTTGGGTQFLITNTASAVNYLQVTGGDGTTTSPRFSAQGSSTDVTVQFQSKGAGELQFFTNSVTRQFNIAHTASAVNYLQVTGSATGNAATLSAQGSDTNIDLALTPKGTGKVRFGTHTGTADVAVTGYIEVKDSAGNVRKLAVIT